MLSAWPSSWWDRKIDILDVYIRTQSLGAKSISLKLRSIVILLAQQCSVSTTSTAHIKQDQSKTIQQLLLHQQRAAGQPKKNHWRHAHFHPKFTCIQNSNWGIFTRSNIITTIAGLKYSTQGYIQQNTWLNITSVAFWHQQNSVSCVWLLARTLSPHYWKPSSAGSSLFPQRVQALEFFPIS